MNHIKIRVKKAVIIAGGQNTKLKPLTTNYCPTWMLPVLNRPLIEYTLNFLKNNNFEDIIIALSEKNEIPMYLNDSGMNIKYYTEHRPRGTAGIVKDFKEFFGKDPFLVINSNLFIGNIDLAPFIEFHLKMGSIVTVGVHRDGSDVIKENIKIAGDKTIDGFYTIHSSIDRRALWRPSGIYVFDPSIFEFISEEHYMDIKEQLIPILQKEGLKVFTHEIDGFYLNINGIRDYIKIHRHLLLENTDSAYYINRREMIAENVWVGKNVTISPRAYLLGPIIIGDNCIIDNWSQIIGPTVIGNKCHISERVLVRESIVWDGVSLENNSKIEYSVLGLNSHIPQGQSFKNIVAVNGLKAEGTNLIPSKFRIKGVVDLTRNVFHAGAKYKTYLILKRIMDITLSTFGLILFFPLFLIIAAAIKMDSFGPVFYIQSRCGKDGRLFSMIKFRTMIANAEELQEELSSKKDIDGPMFKLANDPRVTKIGRILRKISLDELPQLFNVLKGEMSLVGPRPLIMDEIKFSPSWRDTRLKVKPGITGLWQIQGRSEAPFHDWIRYDVHYVKHQSLWLDIKILFKTIKVILKRVGAY